MGIHKENFYKFKELSEVYYVYHHIRRYTVSRYKGSTLNSSAMPFSTKDQPFTSLLPEALMNMSRFLAHKIITKVPPGVSQVYPQTAIVPVYLFIYFSLFDCVSMNSQLLFVFS